MSFLSNMNYFSNDIYSGVVPADFDTEKKTHAANGSKKRAR